MRATWQEARPTLLFYLGYAALTALLEQLAPTRMCAPGAGVLLLLALPFVSGILLFKNAFQLLALQQPRLIAGGLHLMACVIFGGLFLYSR